MSPVRIKKHGGETNVYIGDVNITANDVRWRGFKEYADAINKTLEPITQKAKLCDEMARAIRQYKNCRYEEDPGPYIIKLDNLLEKFDKLRTIIPLR